VRTPLRRGGAATPVVANGLVFSPAWYYCREIEEDSAVGAIRFGSDTAKYFREQILRPYLAQYLKDGAPKANLAPVTAFETGTNQWRKLDRWPIARESGCSVTSRRLYLQPDQTLRFAAPTAGAGYSEFVSDPTHPVPFRARPIQPIGYDPG
jgi:predicted acyl esterase